MAKILYALAMLVFAVMIVLAFFQPWVETDTLRASKISQIIIGKQEVFGRSISGYDIPVLANGPDSRLIISIIKIFKPQITNADKKSYLVWGVPGLAVLLFLLSLILAKNKLVNLAIGIIGVAIFAVAAYKVTAADLDRLAVVIRIGSGLWMTLWGYLGMGAAAFLRVLELSLAKKG